MSNPIFAVQRIRARFTSMDLVFDNFTLDTDVSVFKTGCSINCTLVNNTDGDEIAELSAVLDANGRIEITESSGENVHIAIKILNRFETEILGEVAFLKSPILGLMSETQ